MVTPQAVTEVSAAEVVAARRWLSDTRADVDAELIAELPASVVYRTLARRYDHGWPQFQRDHQQARQAQARPPADAAPRRRATRPADPLRAAAVAMSVIASTIAERARYQADERALLADAGMMLGDETRCRECGCSDSLACPQGCGWTQPDLCSACADELDALADPLDIPPTEGARRYER